MLPYDICKKIKDFNFEGLDDFIYVNGELKSRFYITYDGNPEEILPIPTLKTIEEYKLRNFTLAELALLDEAQKSWFPNYTINKSVVQL